MVTLIFERYGWERERRFSSLNDCVHSAAMLTFEGAILPSAIYDDSGTLWRGDSLRDLLRETALRHGWVNDRER